MTEPAYLDFALRQKQKQFEYFGWSPEADSFLLGATCYRADGNHGRAPLGRVLQPYLPALSTKGSLEAWKAMAAQYNAPGMEPYAFALLTAFGAPLMKFLGFGGVILSLRGPSGSGKTTVQRMICSVYGDPYAAHGLMLTRDSMESARIQRLSVMHSLPVCLDEITNMPPAELSDLCYTVSQGVGRASVDKNGRNEVAAGSWNTIMTVSTNASLYDRLSKQKADASAEALRVFEIEVPEVKAGLDFSALRENYGLAGHVYLNKLIAYADMRVYTSGGNPEERFWAALVAATRRGGHMAEGVGLLPQGFTDRLGPWFGMQIAAARSAITDTTMTAEEALLAYLKEYEELTAEAQIDCRGMRQWAEIKRNWMVRTPVGNADPVILKVQGDGTFLAGRTHFREWCRRSGVEYNRIKDALRKKQILLATDISAKLKPYEANTPYDFCIRFDENRLRGLESKVKFMPQKTHKKKGDDDA